MRPNKKFFCLVLTLVIAVSSLTFFGCSSGNKERMEDPDTLYVGFQGTSFPSSYMPWQSRDGIAPTISSMIYNTLFSYDDVKGIFTPLIAKEWCYIDKDGNPLITEDGGVDYEGLERCYGSSGSYIPVKVTLFDNVTWSDGKPVTVDDVYFSFDLCADNSRSNHAGALAWVSDLNHSYSGGVRTSYGIYTANHNLNNKYTFTEEEKDTVMYLHTKKVLGAVTTLFTTILILPQHIWEPIISKENPINSTTPNEALLYQYSHPIGCGGWTLDVESSNAQVIVLDRREDYHLKDEKDPSKPLYKVDRIKFILYQEQNIAIFSLLKGYIDVLDGSINPNYKSLFNNEDDIEVLETGNQFVLTLLLNVNPPSGQENVGSRKYLSNKDFRKAIALAIDQDDLIKNVQNGAASKYSSGLVSKDLSDIYSEESDIFKDISKEDRIKTANEILDGICPQKDSLGYRLDNGKRLSFEILGSPATQDLVSFLQIQLQKIGIEVKYEAQGSAPENTYFYTGKFDMTFQSVSFTVSTVDVMMNSHFVTLGKSSNYGRLSNPDLTKKIDKMRTTLNQNLKYELLKEIQVMVAEEYYKIPLYSSNVISVARTDRFKGWVSSNGEKAFSTESLEVLKKVN